MCMTFAYECEIHNSLTLCVFLIFIKYVFPQSNFCVQHVFFFIICNVMWVNGCSVILFVCVHRSSKQYIRKASLGFKFFFSFIFFNICFIFCFDMCMTCCLSKTSMFRSSTLVSSLFIYEIKKKIKLVHCFIWIFVCSTLWLGSRM